MQQLNIGNSNSVLVLFSATFYEMQTYRQQSVNEDLKWQ